jgi:hypothetical protein
MNGLAIGTGGPHVKILATGKTMKKVKKLPRGCLASDNATAIIGGFRLWAQADGGRRPVKQARPV